MRHIALVALWLGTLAADARADALPAVEARAEEHFARGVKLYEKNNFAAALAEFRAAYDLTHAWQVLLNIGMAEENLLHYNPSVEALERYLAEGGAAVPADRRARVERELGHIRSVAAEVTIQVAGSPADIEVDGEAIGKVARPLLLSPGTHRLRATRSGDRPAEKVVSLAAGQKLTIDLTPEPVPQAPTKATLIIESRPRGAHLTMDGRAIGDAPWKAELGEGSYEIAATLDGHAPRSSLVFLKAGQPKTLSIDLSPLKRPWYRRWYVWTAVGLVLASGAAITAGVYVSQPRYYVPIYYP